MPETTPFFYGQSQCLSTIHDTLSIADLTKAIPKAALLGMNGEGKTETAKYYAWTQRQFYQGGIIFISANHDALIKSCFERVAVQLGLLDQYKAAPHVFLPLCQAVYHRLASRGKSLIIFDDAKSLDHIQPYFPSSFEGFSSQHFSVLITSHNSQDFQSCRTRLFLDPKSSFKDALSYIQTQLPQATTEQAQALYQSTHGLPLALSQAIALLKQSSSTSISEYLERVSRGQDRSALAYPSLELPEIAHKRAIQCTWLITLETLHQTTPNVLNVMNHLAFLYYDGIPTELFEQLCQQTDLCAHESRQILMSYGLIRSTQEGSCLCIHPLLQHVIRDQLDKTQWIAIVYQLLRALAQTGRYDRSHLLLMQRISFQTEYLKSQLFDPLIEADDINWYTPEHGQLLYQQALYLIEYELNYAKAEEYLIFAKTIFLAFATDPFLLQHIQRQLAKCYIFLGRLPEARALYPSLLTNSLSVADKQRLLLDQHLLLVAENKLTEAVDLLTPVLAQPQLSLDEQARCHHYLGKVLFSQVQMTRGLVRKIEADMAQLPKWKTKIKASQQERMDAELIRIEDIQHAAIMHFYQAIELKKSKGDRTEITRSYLLLFSNQMKHLVQVRATFECLQGMLEAFPLTQDVSCLPRIAFRVVKAMAQFKGTYGLHGLHEQEQSMLTEKLARGLDFVRDFYGETSQEKTQIDKLLIHRQLSIPDFWKTEPSQQMLRSNETCDRKRKRSSLSTSSMSELEQTRQPTLLSLWQKTSHEDQASKRQKKTKSEEAKTISQGFTSTSNSK